METYVGTCHCRAVEIEVETDLSTPFRCNCSFCTRRGAVLQKVPLAQFRLTKGEAALSRYGARDFSKHFFCGNCGIHVFTRITRAHEQSVVVNVGCLGGVDPATMTPLLFDGASRL